MTQFVGEYQPAIVVTDPSVLINFLRMDRMTLFAGHSQEFIATNHDATEISDRYPEQQQRFAAALVAGAISETSATAPEEIRLFGSLSAAGRLGAGECSAFALAIHRRNIHATDDRIAARHARQADAGPCIFSTQDPVVLMIRMGLLNVSEAERIKQDWATCHRFRLELESSRDLV